MKYTNKMTGKGSFSLAVSDKNIVIYLNISIHYEMLFLVWLKTICLLTLIEREHLV